MSKAVYAVTDLHHTSYRIVEGVKGDLGDGWSYDVYGMYGRSNFATSSQGDWSKTRIQEALQVHLVDGVPTCDVGGACVPLDIFHGFGAITNQRDQVGQPDVDHDRLHE